MIDKPLKLEICETCFFCSFCTTIQLPYCDEEDYVNADEHKRFLMSFLTD